MKKTQTIPIVFGVTGHRDLRPEDIPQLEKSVRALLAQYQQNYAHTQLIVISALAEGADRLVARVAKELGIRLHVLLPYQEDEYIKSFDEPGNLEEFNELMAYASRTEINSCVHTYGAETCYQQLGERLADLSNILLALWDGVDSGKPGGTSAVVKYQRAGLKENRFDPLDGNAIFIIKTPRKSNPDVSTDFKVHKEFVGKHIKGKAFEKMLTKVDELNARIEPLDLIDNSLAKSYMVHFDNAALGNQRIFKRASVIMLILTALAFASLEIMHVLHLKHFILGYGIGLLLAFGLYWIFLKNGKVQDDFVHYRGFAEALRVQNAWNCAGVDKSVAKYHLKDQHHKFTWLKLALKNLYYLDKDHKPFTMPYTKDANVDAWIDGQIDYFKNAAQARHEKFERLERVEKWLYRLGFVVLMLMFIIYALESLHLVEHGALWFSWHHLVLVSSLLLMTAAFIGEKYVKIEGYEDDIYHFNAMQSIFEEAREALAATTKDSPEYRKIEHDLGIKALDENSKWIILHDSMRARLSLD